MSIFLLNPFILAQPAAMIERAFASSGYNAARLTTTTTLLEVTTLSTIESTGFNYAAFWQATGDNSSTGNDFIANYNESNSIRQTINIRPQDTTDAFAAGGVHPYAGVANNTHYIDFQSGASTAGIAGRAINVLTLDASDKWAFNANVTTSTADAVSVTITDPGDYLVIGSGMLGGGGNAYIFDGTNSYGEVGVAMNQNASTYSPFWHVVKLSLTNQTLSVRVTVDQIKQASILALKLDKFENAYYSEQTTQSTTSSTTFVDAFTYTPTLVNPGNYHLILGAAQLQINSATRSAGAKLTNQSRGTNYNVAHFRENNTSPEWYPTPVARISSFVDPSPTLAWELYTENSNSTARLRNMAIAVLDLGIAAPPAYFIGVTTVVDSSSITLSDQIEEGDIVVIAGHSTSVSIATPTGYTAGQSGNSNTVNYNWSYKIQGATPDTTASGLTTGGNVKYIAMVFRYVNTTTPIEANPAISTAGAGLPDSPSVTTSNASIILSIGFLDDDSVVADTTAPVGYTLCGVEQSGGTLMAAYKVQTASGTEDPGAFTGGGTDTWVAATVALRLA